MKFTTGVFCGAAACLVFFWAKEGQSEEHGKAIISAYNKGKTDALKTDKPSWELEQSCVSLWAGRQE